MKREALLRYLREHGCVLKREGGSHSIWINREGFSQAVPRHAEIADLLSRSICRKLGLADPLKKNG